MTGGKAGNEIEALLRERERERERTVAQGSK